MGYYAFVTGEFKHHGVLGMRWGVRRYQPYPSGKRVKGGKEVGEAKKTAMSSSDKKEYNKQRKATGAAYKVLKKNTKLTDKAAKSVKNAEKEYDKALNKKALPWNRKKRRAEIERAASTLSDVVSSFERKEANRKNSADDYNREFGKLVNVTNHLLKKTNDISSKDLYSRNVSIGKDWTINVLSNAKTPLLTGRYVREWESARKRAS